MACATHGAGERAMPRNDSLTHREALPRFALPGHTRRLVASPCRPRSLAARASGLHAARAWEQLTAPPHLPPWILSTALQADVPADGPASYPSSRAEVRRDRVARAGTEDRAVPCTRGLPSVSRGTARLRRRGAEASTPALRGALSGRRADAHVRHHLRADDGRNCSGWARESQCAAAPVASPGARPPREEPAVLQRRRPGP